MALGPFIWGGSTGIRTPQEAAHLRAIAEALAGQGRAPQNIGEGLSAIGDAIASRRYRMRADRMESEGRAAYQSKYGDLLKTLLSGGGGAADPVPTAPGGEVPPQPDLSQAHPEYLTGGGMPPPPTATNVANTQLPPPEDLNAIVRTVIGEAGNQSPEGQRAVAEVILNRARESGMTPQQVVSAKGQFEPWATRGAELNAIDPNSQQYQSVLSNITPSFGPDDPTGGADHFYSPGAQAALGRDAPDWAQGQQGTDIGDQRFYSLGYGGDPGTSGAQDATAAQASGQPIQTAGLSITGSDEPQPEPRPQQVAASGGFDPRLIDALNDPWAPEGTKAILGALLEQQLKRAEPPDYGFTTEGGDFYRTNPRTGQVEKVLDNPDAPKPYSFTTEGGDIFKMDPNTGKVEKAYDSPAAGEPGGASDEYGTTPIYYTDKDGNLQIMQMSKSGGAKQAPLPEGAKLQPGVEKLDAGDHWILYDQKTATVVGTVPKNVAGEAAQKEAGTSGEKKLQAILDAADAAEGSDTSLSIMEQAMADPAFYSGAGAEQVLQMRKWGAALGMTDTEGISSMETFQAQAKRQALQAMGGSLGSGFSNADRDFVEGQFANLTTSPEGNKRLLAITREINKRKVEIADLANEYADAHDGTLDRHWRGYLKDWAEKNPIFPKQGSGKKAEEMTTEELLKKLEGQ